MAKSKKKQNEGLKAIVAMLFVLAVIALIVFLLLLQPKDNDTKSNLGDDIVSDNIKGTENTTRKDLLEASALPDATTPVQETNESGTTKIFLLGMTASVEGQGAKVEGKTVKITRGGIYELSGTLDDGRILVKAKGEDVVLIFNGVNITCSDSSPLYVNKANSVTVLLNGTTENILTDGDNYDFTLEYADLAADEPNNCVYSKDDLIIRGTGSLIVNANYNGGIKSNDNLSIINTNVTVNAKNHGINGKDSLLIQNSTVNVTSGGDGLRSTQDTDPVRGYAQIVGSNVFINSTEDAIQVETGLTVTNSSMHLVACGGHNASTLTTTGSAKGIKVNQGYAEINAGHIIIDSLDDCFNVAGNITINGSELADAANITLYSGDDGIHSDATITIAGDQIFVEESKEGIEGMAIVFEHGTVYINAKDDGINTAGGADGEEFEMMAGNPFAANDTNNITINGGYIVVNANGDGVDSNGNIYLNGGVLIVNGPTNAGNGALDYAGDFYIEGGTLLATGASGMAQVPDNLNQPCISVTFDKTLTVGDIVNISNGEDEHSFYIAKAIDNLIYSAGSIQQGTTYTVSYGGKYKDGTVTDGICNDGSYSGGTTLCELTIDDMLVSYGRVGIGGSMGGNMFGEPGKPGKGHGEGKRPPM